VAHWRPLLWAVALCSLSTRTPAQAPPLTTEEKSELTAAAGERLVPRNGRWVVSFRDRRDPAEEETVAWDSASPTPYARTDAFGGIDLPCWVPLLIRVRATGLEDADGRPYTGPLMARVPDSLRVVGPYPEGFLCSIEGALELLLIPHAPPFASHTAGFDVAYRMAYPQVLVEGKLWPLDSLTLAEGPLREAAVFGQRFNFTTMLTEGCAFPPVRSIAAGPTRELSAEASFTFAAAGVPARHLPVRFEWTFDRVEGTEAEPIVHDTETNAKGIAADSVNVPVAVKAGRVTIWYHDDKPDFGPAATVPFDFSRP